MKTKPWILPRTRVGSIATLCAAACVGYAVVTGSLAGGGFWVAVAVSMLLAWTAVLRHNEHCVILWVLTALGTGWLLVTSYAYLGL